MKQERKFPSFTVTKKAQESIQEGHPWVYSDEILNIKGEYVNGDLADVYSEKGSYLGTGLISEKSKIRIRILSNNANETFSDEFFRRRIKYALDYRKTVMKDDFSCCRIIFGEADGFPGLTIDKYNNILVSQILSYGIEIRKDMIFNLLTEEFSKIGCEIEGIYERNDSQLRDLEGLKQNCGWYSGYKHPENGVIIIEENGIKYEVDIENGQKTGFFLDQKYNRKAVGRLAEGMKVLDCFTHTGSFGLNCAKGNAKSVTCVDISQSAIELASHNAELNGLDDKMNFICEDIFSLLPKLEENHETFDLIILDPPAFTKSRKTILDARRGYKEINYRAMKILKRGSYLATCSCSHFMSTDMFLKMLKSAAKDAGVELKLIEQRRQGPDHPYLLNIPETDYLKFFILQIV